MNKIAIKKIPKKILVIKPSSLGDIIHSLPFLSAINETFPRAEVHWVISKGLEYVLEDHPMVKKLVVINKNQWKNIRKVKDTISEAKALSRDLRSESYDIVIDLQGLLRSGLIAKATRSSLRIGFKEAREGGNLFYTHKIKGGREIHAVDRYMKIAGAIGCDIEEVRFPMPLIKESDNVSRLKRETGKYAVIIPGARWNTKRWPPERFGKIAAMLRTKTIILGGPPDFEISKLIEKESGGKAISMAGKTDLKELISIIRNASYMISNDSGPIHIAAAFKIPVVAIFGPTNPLRTGPYGSGHEMVRPNIHCSPCYKKNCRDLKCMTDITVERVLEAVRALGAD